MLNIIARCRSNSPGTRTAAIGFAVDVFVAGAERVLDEGVAEFAAGGCPCAVERKVAMPNASAKKEDELRGVFGAGFPVKQCVVR